MTCVRKPLSIEQILQDTLRIRPQIDFEYYTGKKRNWFEKCSNPNENSQLSMVDAELLDNALAANGYPRWFSDHWNRNTMTDDEYRVECLFRSYTKAGGAFGELGRVIEKVMADGKLDDHEKPELYEAALRCKHTVQPFKEKGLTALDRRNGAAGGKRIREMAQRLEARE